MISPVDVILLHGIRQALGVKNELIQLETIGEDIIGFRRIAVFGCTEVERGSEPSVDLRAAFGAINSGHQRITIAIRLSDYRRTAVRPIGIRKWRRIQRRRKSAARWSNGGSRRGSDRWRPILTIEFSP